MTDMNAAYASWRKLMAAGARTIYPAHGRPFDAQLLRRDLDAYRTAELVRFF
jgi:glyoxylase-like metal-dependent hydrolase (beta-lactamase superfamily II)